MNTNSKRLTLSLLLTLLVGILFVGHSLRHKAEASYLQNIGYIFGTQYHITYQHTTDLEQGIIEELQKIDNSLSTFNAQSTLSKINRNENFQLDSMCLKVISLALQVSNNTEGAFDITVAPLVNAWGFGFKNMDNVTSKQIDSIMPFVGYKQISISQGQLIKQNPLTMLDCSGIAKGFACDAVAEYFNRQDIQNYLIEIGGEIRAKGVNKKQEAWNIGVSSPEDDSLQVVTNKTVSLLHLTDAGMATSGNYRNFYYKDGKKYAHTIDPRTGYPVQHSILSATVISPTCAEADAYATAFMVLGLDGAKKVLEQQKQLKAYLIYSDQDGHYNTWSSPNL